ncbi:hypothetical protein V7114_14330 [Neobacillus niacini]|uniref:hypothetical protein n=1 Tax=Neobacillus niacini TaxID=86668 RepID=UPI0030009645
MISKTSMILETSPDNLQIFQKIIYAESLLDKIQELEVKYSKPQIIKESKYTINKPTNMTIGGLSIIVCVVLGYGCEDKLFLKKESLPNLIIADKKGAI